MADVALTDLVRPGMRIALADGTSSPHLLHAELSRAAAAAGDVRLVVGWHPAPAPDLDVTAFADVVCIAGGPALRAGIDAGTVRFTPSRLSAVPSLLAGPLRPDLVVATLVRDPDGFRMAGDAGWTRRLIDAGVPVAALVSHTAPHSDAGPPLPDAAITVVAESQDRASGPAEIRTPAPTADDVAIAAHVAGLVPEGARVQVGPGRLAAAMVAALRVPVRVDSGLLPEPVVDLDAAGLLLGDPVCAYLIGTRRLHEWADGRRLLHPVEVTHDVGRLSSADLPPLVALNAALEIDVDGQINVEGIGDRTTGLIGGHPDFAAAGARSVGGLSVIALASRHRDRPTLVSRLSRPVTTASHDVEIVVTERGIADLRGLDRRSRRAALLDLWGDLSDVG
ncbi:acetyl-CoA hydrolase/transferase C-terminal domain-containing protein [Pseudonocardia sp. N23]|uniref:acetyl-CoA hydrolase/transferase C-terminal domain-containing protein n=1 Tax=Pseudonocardia sp. N23 TaxID=1987376 RepID=UPI000C0324BB|nr:acetyl-CoA hydrolase/transferase C-terminal domain-containing protein [Pseudonocardia sp. N23]GAY08219.1 4-hydroxybutyrate coenzyme A transferase [Pseudonocardia sp. N23]